MFGKVAKGFFTSDLGGAGVTDEVEKLLGRIADGVLPQDRREALLLLSELLQSKQEAQEILGMNGLPVLCAVLKDEQGDKEMLRGALECLNIALAPSPDNDRQSPNAINAELFARGKENIALLLGLLQDETDFYVRYHTVQLLTVLAAGGSHRLSEAILAAPMGVAKLMDLLGDSHEVVRNEALLLLVGLTRASTEIKRIAAFEGVFERLLNITKEEGGTEGGIVVQDCFELLSNLLRNNQGNQLIFRESGHLQQLLQMLKLPESQFSRSLPRQRATNMLSLLDTFIALLLQQTDSANGQAQQRTEPQRQHNAQALLKGGLLDKLLMLALKGNDPTAQAVRNQGLLCLAHLISEFQPGQERLVMSGLGWLKGTPALRQILRICLHTREPSEHMATRSVIRAFCRGNPNGQSMLVATLIPVADQGPDSTTFGGEIIKALSQPEVAVSSRAAAVLTCMIDNNPATKQRLLTMPLELSPAPGSPPTFLMLQCISHLSNAIYSPGTEDQHAAAVFLRLLVTWMSECQPAAQAFQAMPSNLPFVVDIVTGRKGGSNAAVTGLAALLLGSLLIAEQGESNSSVVLDSITTKVGLAAFFEKLDGLYSDQQFQAAAAGPKAPKPGVRTALPPPQDEEEEDERPSASAGPVQHVAENPFDHGFAQWALEARPLVRQHLISGESGAENGLHEKSRGTRLQSIQGSSEAEQLEQARSIIQALEREMESLKSRNRALTQQALDLQHRPSRPEEGSGMALPPFAAVSQEQASKGAAALQDAEQRASEAEAQVNTLRRELESLQERNKQSAQQLQDLEEKLREATRDAAEAQAAAAKYEADLEALSGAYTDLESHAHRLEASCQEAVPQPSTSGVDGKREDEDDSADDQLSDLLICLGQEEQKVERLQRKLQELGVDPGPLLARLGSEEGDEEEGADADAHNFI